jgi:hypothetical protein
MSNPLTDLETEAVSLLQAGNPQAFGIMIGYFERMCEFEKSKCVDTNIEKVPIHQGRARAFRDAMNIHVDATNRLSSE